MNMRFPSPSYRAYLEFVVTVLGTMTVLQYTGIILGRPGEFDFGFLAVLALSLPISAYLLTVAAENVNWVSQWDKMVQNGE